MLDDLSPRIVSDLSEASTFSTPSEGRSEPDAPVLCLSHLRWDFVFQRPQHLMSRFAKSRRVVFFEEAMPAAAGEQPFVELRTDAASGVRVATPRLPEGLHGEAADVVLRQLLDGVVKSERLQRPVVWYYTPMMMEISRQLDASAIVYDCMDELSNFKFAPPQLRELERELLSKADVVFTGGYSIWEAKQDQHRNIHPMPSSVDRAHFARARNLTPAQQPEDQRNLPGPRLGYYGVIDERMDLSLVAALAEARPDWSIVMVGPVVKINDADLPRLPNLHWLGGKTYDQLPLYLGGWDVALAPFAINEHTRFISPTKTPEYLAGGRPVVSTPIVDVVRHYGDLEGVRIASTPDEFVAECDVAVGLFRDGGDWLKAADGVLSEMSWDKTFARMDGLLRDARPPAVSKPAVLPAGRKSHYDALIVGAGFAGSVLAERLASTGKRVLVCDRRPHIGGNAYDKKDEAGVLMHQYGPHIFHTNSEEIFKYLSRFTAWRPYEHRVLGSVRDKLVPIPINRTTLNALYGAGLKTDAEAADFLASRAEPVAKIETSEDVVVNAVGRELYELFFRGYTRKQWGMDPSELDKSVTARVPTRTNTDDRYFTDTYQAMPLYGYTRMFENMLDNDNIRLALGAEYRDVKQDVNYDRLIFSGPVDEFFDHRYGKLPYRSLRFQHETLDQAQFQEVGTVNYPAEDVPYTRISEYKHLTGQTHDKTTITYEYPSAEGDPYYPIPRPENQALYKKYEALALATPEVTFVGRLATYRYYNMDQVVGQALATFRRLSAAEDVLQPVRRAANAPAVAATA